MAITVQTSALDNARVQRALDDLARRQMPFAAARALDFTSRDVQDVGKALVLQQFVSRKTSTNFVRRQPTRVTKAQINQPIKIGFFRDGSALGARADIFAKFARPGVKTSIRGRPVVAMPARDNRGRGGGGREKLARFLPFAEASAIRGRGRGRRVVAGQRGTFLLSLPNNPRVDSILLKRQRGGNKALFVFVEGTRIPPQLQQFEPLGRQRAREAFPRHFRAAFVQALRTARLRGTR